MPLVEQGHHRCRRPMYSGSPGDIWQCQDCGWLWKFSGLWQDWVSIWRQEATKQRLGL